MSNSKTKPVAQSQSEPDLGQFQPFGLRGLCQMSGIVISNRQACYELEIVVCCIRGRAIEPLMPCWFFVLSKWQLKGGPFKKKVEILRIAGHFAS